MKSADDQKFWGHWAKKYGSVIGRTSAGQYQKVCQTIRPKLERSMDVLELACGTGQLSYPLSSCVHLWEATDFSPAMIQTAKANNHSARLHFSVQDATHLPYAPESFDVAVIANALHIMPCPEQALREIRQVLKPGGSLFAPTFVQGEPSGHNLKVHVMELFGFHAYHKWSAAEYLQFLAQHGFSVTEHALLTGGLAPLCYVECHMG